MLSAPVDLSDPNGHFWADVSVRFIADLSVSTVQAVPDGAIPDDVGQPRAGEHAHGRRDKQHIDREPETRALAGSTFLRYAGLCGCAPQREFDKERCFSIGRPSPAQCAHVHRVDDLLPDDGHVEVIAQLARLDQAS